MKKIILFIALVNISRQAGAQVSIATDASVLRSLTLGQKFTVFGQSVQGHFHISQKEGAYASVSYYANGNFQNRLTAIARVPASPLFVNYTIQSSLRYRHTSLGWKHYWKGSFDNEESWNLYSTAGFGLLWGRAVNTYNTIIDTAKYRVPQRSIAGSAAFKRLTLDVSIGSEMLLGGGLYLYGEARTWLPASDYPSPYLYNNDVPRIIAINAGLRILLY